MVVDSLVRSVVSYDLIDSVAELEGLEVLEFGKNRGIQLIVSCQSSLMGGSISGH